MRTWWTVIVVGLMLGKYEVAVEQRHSELWRDLINNYRDKDGIRRISDLQMQTILLQVGLTKELN